MNTNSERLRTSLRIIWTIAAKDMVNALKDKTILSTMASMLVLMVFYRVLPIIGSAEDLPRVAIYDAGNSSLVAELEDSAQLDLIEKPSQEIMEAYVAARNTVVLGLVIPADFEERLSSGRDAESTEELELDGFVGAAIARRARFPVDAVQALHFVLYLSRYEIFDL